MIPAMVIADYYRKHKDFEKAAFWLRRAAASDSHLSTQHAIILPYWTSVTPQGDIVLDWSTPNWRFRDDSQPANLAFDDELDRLTISYKNTLGQRDRVIYSWRGPMPLAYWHTLELRARVHRGAFLKFVTHSADGTRTHLNYHRGTGQWETFTIPLQVDDIRFIYISLTEPSADPTVPEYGVDIEPLRLLLDESAGTCE
jgi:hypothetical protein